MKPFFFMFAVSCAPLQPAPSPYIPIEEVLMEGELGMHPPGRLYDAAFSGNCRDGDTCAFYVYTGFDTWSKKWIRFCDIDAPERPLTMSESGKENSNSPGIKSWEVVKMLLNQAATIKVYVAMHNGTEVKSFDRFLAWVFIDGEDLGTALVSTGNAKQSDKRCPRSG